MRAWQVEAPGRLTMVERPVPLPVAGELVVRVEACGVCRTDLHVLDGDLPGCHPVCGDRRTAGHRSRQPRHPAVTSHRPQNRPIAESS